MHRRQLTVDRSSRSADVVQEEEMREKDRTPVPCSFSFSFLASVSRSHCFCCLLTPRLFCHRSSERTHQQPSPISDLSCANQDRQPPFHRSRLMSQPGSVVDGSSISDDLIDDIDHSIYSNNDNSDDRTSPNSPNKGKSPSACLNIPPSYPVNACHTQHSRLSPVIYISKSLRTRDATLAWTVTESHSVLLRSV